MGSFKSSLGAAVKPLGYPSKLEKTKPAENQTLGMLLIWDGAGPYFKIPGTSAASKRFGVVALANNSTKFDGKREMWFGNGEEVRVNVKAGGTIAPKADVIFSTTVAGSVDTVGATAYAIDKIVGRFEHKADEFWKDGINNTFSNAALNDIITITLYETAR